MFDLVRAINIVEGRLAEYQQHSDGRYHQEAIAALELVLNDLNNELHAEMLIMEQFAAEFEQEKL